MGVMWGLRSYLCRYCVDEADELSERTRAAKQVPKLYTDNDLRIHVHDALRETMLILCPGTEGIIS